MFLFQITVQRCETLANFAAESLGRVAQHAVVAGIPQHRRTSQQRLPAGGLLADILLHPIFEHVEGRFEASGMLTAQKPPAHTRAGLG